MLHLLYIAPRVEALRTSTLGWGNATPTELPGVRTFHNGLTIHGRWVRTFHNGLTIHGHWVRTFHNGLTIHGRWVRTFHNGLTIQGRWEHTFHNGLTIHGRWVHSFHIGRYYPHTCCIAFGTGEEDLGKPPYTFPIHRGDGNNL